MIYTIQINKVGYFWTTMRFPQRQLEIGFRCFEGVQGEMSVSSVISSGAIRNQVQCFEEIQKKTEFKFCDFNQGAERNHRSVIRGSSKETSGFLLNAI